MGDHGGGLGAEGIEVAEAGGVDDQGEHAVDDAAVVRRGRLVGAAAGEGAGQDLAHQRQAGALVQAEGEEGASRAAAVHRAGVGGRGAGVVDQAVLGHCLAGGMRHADLADGERAGGEVEDQGRRAGAGGGHGDADGVGAEAGLAAAEGGDDGRAGDGVDEVEREQPGGHRMVAIGADAAEVVDVAQRQQADAAGLRRGDGEVHGLAADHLAEAHAAVDHGDGAVLADDLGAGVGAELAGEDVEDVARGELDAVAVVALQVGLQQVRGDKVRGGLGGAGGLEHPGDGGLQLRRLDLHRSGFPQPACRRGR